MGRLVRRYIRAYNQTVANEIDIEGTLKADTIDEHTSGAGVTIDGMEVKDSLITYLHAKVLKISFGHETSETDTEVDLPDKAIVLAAWLEVTTADSGITINVGTLSSESGGDADGFIKGASVASTGLVIPDVTVTSGTSEDYFSACTIGALLADFTAGSDTATDVGTLNKKFYATDSQTTKSISYTCSSGADTAEGYIYVLLVEME